MATVTNTARMDKTFDAPEAAITRDDTVQRDDSERNPNAALRYSQTRVIPVSEAIRRSGRIVVTDDNDPATVSFKMLRTLLLQRMQSNNMSTVAVTSVDRGAGKTVTAINLAIAMAMDPRYTVLLVDFDFRNPGIAPTLGWKPEQGVFDHLVADVPVRELLVHPGLGRLVVLPGRGSTTQSSELLASPQTQSLVRELKGRYSNRIVVFDVPAMTEGDDMLAFAPYVDGIVLVVEEGKTKRPELARAFSMLPPNKLLGTVLTKSGR